MSSNITKKKGSGKHDHGKSLIREEKNEKNCDCVRMLRSISEKNKDFSPLCATCKSG